MGTVLHIRPMRLVFAAIVALADARVAETVDACPRPDAGMLAAGSVRDRIVA